MSAAQGNGNGNGNGRDPFEDLLELSKAQLECSRINDLDELQRLSALRTELMRALEAQVGDRIWETRQGREREILFKILENDRKLKVTLLERMKKRKEGLAELQRRVGAEKAYRELR